LTVTRTPAGYDYMGHDLLYGGLGGAESFR
jgi:hypothetical protein